MYFTGTPKRLAISPAMSGATPTGSPASVLPVTSRKFDRLMPARSTPLGANSALTCCDMGTSSCLAGADCDEAGCGHRPTRPMAIAAFRASTASPRQHRSRHSSRSGRGNARHDLGRGCGIALANVATGFQGTIDRYGTGYLVRGARAHAAGNHDQLSAGPTAWGTYCRARHPIGQ